MCTLLDGKHWSSPFDQIKLIISVATIFTAVGCSIRQGFSQRWRRMLRFTAVIFHHAMNHSNSIMFPHNDFVETLREVLFSSERVAIARQFPHELVITVSTEQDLLPHAVFGALPQKCQILARLLYIWIWGKQASIYIYFHAGLSFLDHRDKTP